MRLDGEVYAIADGWSPIDVADTAAVRAEAVMNTRSARLIASDATAAWIWGALDALPRRREFCADIRARARVRPGADAAVREVRLNDDDVVSLGARRVTSPARTARDLARRGTMSATVAILNGIAQQV